MDLNFMGMQRSFKNKIRSRLRIKVHTFAMFSAHTLRERCGHAHMNVTTKCALCMPLGIVTTSYIVLLSGQCQPHGLLVVICETFRSTWRHNFYLGTHQN